MIPQVRFFTHDLNEPIPFNMVVDLGTCLEVAEHITPEAAKNLIKWLCEHSKIILFSGAQPKQGGMGHINEQWMCHWIGLFNEQGWSANGWIRETLWDDTTIPWWYRQNILMFEHKAYVRNIGFVLDCIHPGKIDGSK